jgi:hypothetical protein
MALTASKSARIGWLLCRVVVPLWVLSGAILKLQARTPKLLPRNIWTAGAELGIDLYWLLAAIIALELLAIGVMVFLGRLARPMAIFMLGVFCLVLIGEVVAGNTDCGCLGAHTPPIWMMMAIDASLLVGVILFPPSAAEVEAEPKPLVARGPLTGAVAWVMAGCLVSGAIILPEAGAKTIIEDPPEEIENGSKPEPGRAPVTRQLPGYYLPKCEEWVGRKWSEIDLAAFVKNPPADLDQGPRYLIFYSRTCDHCEELFDLYFADPPPVPTLAIAIPERKNGFETEGLLNIYCNQCDEGELPVGCEWIITTPIVVALQDGEVVCVVEGEDPEEPQCLMWH